MPFQVAGEEASVGNRRSPDDVVDTTLKALARKRPSVVHGRRNAVVATIATRLPERVAITVAERSVRPTDH
ncbi:hypothetical protein O4214_29700 [Rhodococcus erythropolis]|nr:hypothetical protein [Rhodococcus qingshengii]MCZ4528170.1 hypothetical protein [Rhodococcus erythropolis]